MQGHLGYFRPKYSTHIGTHGFEYLAGFDTKKSQICYWLNSSQNKKSLNDVTAAPFSVSFSQLPAAKKHQNRGSCDVIRPFLFRDNFTKCIKTPILYFKRKLQKKLMLHKFSVLPASLNLKFCSLHDLYPNDFDCGTADESCNPTPPVSSVPWQQLE